MLTRRVVTLDSWRQSIPRRRATTPAARSSGCIPHIPAWPLAFGRKGPCVHAGVMLRDQQTEKRERRLRLLVAQVGRSAREGKSGKSGRQYQCPSAREALSTPARAAIAGADCFEK
jgi:hypothetical protein